MFQKFCNIFACCGSNGRKVIKMVKLREAKYCNLKLFLILLVVFGHLIEPKQHWLYRVIYAFHMPAFAMLSGVFLQRDRLAAARKLLLCYTVLQTIAVILGKTTLLTPYWHLWYLLSNACWILLARVLERFGKWVVLTVAILFACLIGYVPQIGRTLSLSRTIVFFPYYWMGQTVKRSKAFALTAVLVAVIGLVFLKIPTNFFYHANAYGELAYGGLFRLACYAIGFGFCCFLITFAPNRRFVFTKIGADTLTVYLFHAPVVLFLRKYDFSLFTSALLSVAIVWLFYKLQQEKRYFYGIREGRGRRWHHFKSSTKSMQKRSTDFSSL